MELYSDTYYIQRVQEGDTACFACLVDRYSQPVFALIDRIVQNREEAEELTQDTWLKVFAHLSGFKQQSSFSTWLYRIAYNLAISATRRDGKNAYLLMRRLLSESPRRMLISGWVMVATKNRWFTWRGHCSYYPLMIGL